MQITGSISTVFFLYEQLLKKAVMLYNTILLKEIFFFLYISNTVNNKLYNEKVRML